MCVESDITATSGSDEKVLTRIVTHLAQIVLPQRISHETGVIGIRPSVEPAAVRKVEIACEREWSRCQLRLVSQSKKSAANSNKLTVQSHASAPQGTFAVGQQEVSEPKERTQFVHETPKAAQISPCNCPSQRCSTSD